MSVELTRLRELQHLVFLCLSYTEKIKCYLLLYAQHWQQYLGVGGVKVVTEKGSIH